MTTIRIRKKGRDIDNINTRGTLVSKDVRYTSVSDYIYTLTRYRLDNYNLLVTYAPLAALIYRSVLTIPLVKITIKYTI